MTDRESHSPVLLLVQLDDCPGELLGDALERLHDLGAWNLQLLSSVTKKGRPGHVLLIDCPAFLEGDIAEYLAEELGVWGYHALASSHRHLDVRIERRRVVIGVGEERASFEPRFKVLRRKLRVLRVKADFEDLKPVCAFLAAQGLQFPLETIRSELERAVRHSPEDEELVLRFS